jgi:hypothetical protein
MNLYSTYFVWGNVLLLIWNLLRNNWTYSTSMSRTSSGTREIFLGLNEPVLYIHTSSGEYHPETLLGTSEPAVINYVRNFHRNIWNFLFRNNWTRSNLSKTFLRTRKAFSKQLHLNLPGTFPRSFYPSKLHMSITSPRVFETFSGALEPCH